MSAHTPGPWRIGDAGNTVFGPKIEGRVSPETIARLDRTSNRRPNIELIAAAPEMLEALRELRKQLREHVKFDVKKHYSLMVADADAGTILHRIEGTP